MQLTHNTDSILGFVRPVFVLSILALAGCTINPPQKYELAALEDDTSKVHCSVEAPIGTSIKTQVCRSEQDILREKEAANTFLGRLRSRR